MADMGLGGGLEKLDGCIKQTNRFLLTIPYVSDVGAAASLPALQAARPSLSFKEMEIFHLNETIYRPGRPEWQPLEVVLYDIHNMCHPVFAWLKSICDSKQGKFNMPGDVPFFKQVQLDMLDGTGNKMERWEYVNAYPSKIDFGTVNMDTIEIAKCNLTLRYDRAYLVEYTAC